MKKLLLFISLTLFGTFTFMNAQVIEDFESITMNLFSGGTNGALDVIPNPDQNGNTTNRVGEMVRGFDGDPWAGWYADLDEAFNPTDNRYVHLWVWKPRISPVAFKLENPDTGGNTGDVFPINAQSVENGWEELVFDFSTFSEDFTRIVLIPDFENPLTLTEDIIIYFDEMYANDDPTPGSAPVVLFEGFEPIQLTLFSAGTNGALEVIANPDPTVNETNFVAKMTRGFDGDPWAGVFADVAEPIDPAVTPYIHVMVWKPRISPVWFKLENPDTGGNTGDVAPMEAQSMENGWEKLTFDFSGFAGEEFTRIVLLPDFENPLTLTEDIVLYFDEIMKSDQGGGEENARVQVIHNSADAAAAVVDVWLNETLLLDDFAFRTASPFVDAPAGEEFTISIKGPDSENPENPIWSMNYTLEAGETYVLVANGIVSETGYDPATPFDIYVYGMGREAATNGDNTDVLVFHGSTDAPTVDVVETGVGAGTIVDDISYGEYQGYLELPTADYQLSITDETGETTVAVYAAPLETLGLGGAALVTVASGFLNPANNSDGPAFGLWVALPAGGPLVELPNVTSVEENPNNTESLKVYPNPASDVLNIQNNVEYETIIIYSINGQVVYQTDNPVSRIYLEDFQPGVYTVKADAKDGKVYQARFIVK